MGKARSKPCLKRLENGEKVLDELNRAISGCRRYFGCSEVEIRAVPKAQVEGETDTYEIPSQLESKFVTKRFSVCYISMSFFGSFSTGEAEDSDDGESSPLIRKRQLNPCITPTPKRLRRSTSAKKKALFQGSGEASSPLVQVRCHQK